MNEIGSEFWTGSTKCDGSGVEAFLPPGFNIQYVLSGRTALDIIITDIRKSGKYKKAYLPSYCCYSMIEPFISNDVAIEYYDVVFSEKGILFQFNIDNDCDIVLLMNYFGFINPVIAELAADQHERNKVVIYDATHSIFCTGMEYLCFDYVFASFRKWFGVNAGFCGKSTDWKVFPSLCVNHEFSKLRRDAFDLKRKYIDGRRMDKNTFLELFAQAEHILESDYKAYICGEEDERLLQQIDANFIRETRRKNADTLIKNLIYIAGENFFIPFQEVQSSGCPLFVPIYVKKGKRDDLRRYLIQRQIYLPVHWPVSGFYTFNERSSVIYDAELSCVCDQRYTEQDMCRIITEIKDYYL